MLPFLKNTWTIWQEIAPWLLAGLVLAGVLKVFFPNQLLQRWLGSSSLGTIFKAAIIGTPIPLCSCSVLPTAMQLHRSGASKGATVSFLVATPENGADSIALSYVLLGPIMTILRPVAAILSAVVTGLLAQYTANSTTHTNGCSQDTPDSGLSCCCDKECSENELEDTADNPDRPGSLGVITRTALDLLDDMAGWLLVGILFAAALNTLVPANAMVGFGSGLLPMLAIAALSVPMYICATASTPVAASMLAAGMSPGTVLVFLLAGPATNLASAAILRRELGTRTTAAYLTGVVGSAITLGLITDALFRHADIHVAQQLQTAGEIIPVWISFPASILLVLVALKPLRRLFWVSSE